ncbi:cytochrome o ubiquinol oxidase subunit IV [Candidatus Schneideria nysicola]|uniref:cytochrome o ubiquinol oxidase subunit IV n=1 Tax=Candidatus Schneideria nysicola TaxID=1081631 RepID=UPI001CAA4A3E|nr:cytochrome o ubiquinol oxidase subunit IV [Candidatus Schneideria nysicola]UAJ65974.1 cytochrome o ubiquinol oxidase subunit IV [Candidatus Schneideria nysicola]
MEEYLKKDNRSGLVAFILSIILTIIPFFLVQYHLMSSYFSIVVLGICAFLQVILHLFYFLHLKITFEQRWNILSLAFTLLISCILIIGTLWIMNHLNCNFYR